MNEAIGWMLLHSLWEGAVIALALALVLVAARSSRIRYAAACAAMVAILCAMAVTLARVTPAPVVRFPAVSLTHVSTPSGPGSPTPPDAKRADEISWLTPLWLAGVLFFYLRGVSGWVATQRLRRVGVCCPQPMWQARLEELGSRLRVSRPGMLLESCLTEVPVVIGYLRPVVLVPVGLLAGLPAAQVDAILLHELAHIRRHDYLTNLLQVFVEGMLFYHPAIWWISGVMRSERENCCDDVVVNATGSALTYASALTALEQRRDNAGLALAATGGSLVNRIQRLLGRETNQSVGAMPVIAAAVLTVSVVTVLMALQVAPERPKTAPPVQVVTPPAQVKVLAQNVQAPAPRPAAAISEPSAAFEDWATQDVAYIISDEERNAFKRLTTNEEREHFVEQFWARRDPTPGTEENEYKQEHYRRIAYVNDHFPADVPGWKTDRGRIYIQYGPPNEIETHPAGSYQRPASEGGGTTQTYAFEQWRYRWIEGIGDNVIIEFVDPAGRNEYRMTMDPRDKDALLQLQRQPGSSGR